MKIGYSRVSSSGQSLDIQNELLTEAGVERIFAEKQSGGSLEGRTEMHGLLTMLRPGDEVYITRMDRMARSVQDTLRIIKEIDSAGATLHVIQQPIETRSAAGKMFTVMIAAFSEFELEIRKSRQAEGIAKALAAKKYKGRPRGPSYDRAVIAHMHERQGMTPRRIAKQLGCTEWTIRRALKEIGAAREAEAQPSP